MFFFQLVKKIIMHLLSFFFDNRCRFCKKTIDNSFVFCSSCLNSISFISPILLKKKYPLYSLGYYDGILRFIVTEKYRKQNLAYYALADKIFSMINFFNLEFDFIIPVPKTTVNMFYQRVNPPLIIAEMIAEKYEKKIFIDVFMTEYKTNQAGLPYIERMKMNDEIFFIPLDKQKELFNKKILIIDDVCTSGKTIQSILLQLEKINCASMMIFVIARK